MPKVVRNLIDLFNGPRLILDCQGESAELYHNVNPSKRIGDIRGRHLAVDISATGIRRDWHIDELGKQPEEEVALPVRTFGVQQLRDDVGQSVLVGQDEVKHIEPTSMFAVVLLDLAAAVLKFIPQGSKVFPELPM